MSVYLVAFSNQPQKGTACIYKDGVRVATYDERASRAPSTDYLLNQARQRCRYEDDTVEECNLDWPMPEKLDAKPKASGPVKRTGKASDEYDKDVKRVDDND